MFVVYNVRVKVVKKRGLYLFWCCSNILNTERGWREDITKFKHYSGKLGEYWRDYSLLRVLLYPLQPSPTHSYPPSLWTLLFSRLSYPLLPSISLNPSLLSPLLYPLLPSISLNPSLLLPLLPTPTLHLN